MIPKRTVRFLSTISCIAVLAFTSGCAEQENYDPEITGNVIGLHRSSTPAEIVIPAPPKEKSVYIAKSIPAEWIPDRLFQ